MLHSKSKLHLLMLIFFFMSRLPGNDLMYKCNAIMYKCKCPFTFIIYSYVCAGVHRVCRTLSYSIYESFTSMVGHPMDSMSSWYVQPGLQPGRVIWII